MKLTTSVIRCKGAYYDASMRIWSCTRRKDCARFDAWEKEPARPQTPIALYLCGNSVEDYRGFVPIEQGASDA